MSNELQLLEFDYQGTKLSCPLQQGMRMIPVRPVCELIDINFQNQDKWLKSNPLFNMVYKKVNVKRSDNNNHPMNCLSILDMFGWLNHISNSNNRKEGSYEKQLQLLFWLRELHLGRYKELDVIKEDNEREILLEEKIEDIQIQRADLKRALKELDKEEKDAKQALEELRINKRSNQIEINFDQKELR